MATPDLKYTLAKDRHYLRQAFKNPSRFGGENKVAEKLAKSQALYQQRQHDLPKPEFDNSLPVHEKMVDIKAAIQQHQVVIVCGETGSGKTTQLPKICLELGRGVAGLIGHTQPRRLAARSVASRIADELKSPLGSIVGYKVRFQDQSSSKSYIKLMTDGILLAETQNDRYLNAYDTIIIDEAHERSLNIDFLLGFLKQLLPKRPDLKVIITSATIDAKRFSEHFNQAPVIEVSGRTFPVTIHYRPLNTKDEDDAEIEINEAIVDAVDELCRVGDGDILVFLPGERDIREAADALRKSQNAHYYDVLPLFARLSNQDQQKIFSPSGNTRRIVLSTNVAETSLTVPGIRYVIDSGLARVKRYSARAKVEQLHIEKISQAAAKQRAGRCGRVAAGVCIRLYSDADFLSRPEFTDPEILRSNLAAVILRMASLGLGNVAQFPFLEAPAERYINDGFLALQELGAVTNANQLTALGKKMATLPIDPKISRMLLAAEKHLCVNEMLILVSALSIQDPRERPFEAREAADRAHQQFTDKQSDFVAYLNLWARYQKAREQLPSQKARIKWCKEHFLSHLRIREWRELHQQLSQLASEMGLKSNTTEATFEQIHRALLTGLVSNTGMKSPEGHDYQGARGIHFHLFPASGLFKAKPKWVMAESLTETSKLYAKDVAQIDPVWIEKEAPHLVKYHYFEPHWSQKRGEVLASERVTLYGLTIIPRRLISYGKIDPQISRELFIRGALVAGEHDIQAPFIKHNNRLIKDIVSLEHKSRKQDVLVDDEAVFAFYQTHIPEQFEHKGKTQAIVDIASFEIWRKHIEITEPKRLFMQRDDLMQHAADNVTEAQFPEFWHTDDGKFKLSYRFEPRHILDGITLTIPLTVLNRLNAAKLEWLVPGFIREKLTLYIKALPKSLRRICVPIPDFLTSFLSQKLDYNASILPQLAKYIGKYAGNMRLLDDIDMDDWQNCILPEHCYMNIRIIDDGGRELGMGRDLLALQNNLGQAAAVTFRDNSQDFERHHIIQWDIGTLPEKIDFARGKQQLTGFLALQQEKDQSISLSMFDTQSAAEQSHRQGLIALMALQLKEHVRDLNKGLPDFNQIAMTMREIGVDALKADITQAVCDRAFIGDDELPRSEKDFKEQIKRARSRLPAVKQALNAYLLDTSTTLALVKQKMQRHPLQTTLQNQLNTLLSHGFVSRTPWTQWPHMTRYLKAMILRIEKYSSNPQRDKDREHDIQMLLNQWQEKMNQQIKQQLPIDQHLACFFWHIQELRVSLFAQELKTPYPVSLKRLDKIWQDLTKIH